MGDAHAPKPQLPPFTPPKFHWNQDNLHEQFKSFKCVAEFAFKGICEKCSNSVKCGSILNWLGVEAYPVYDNLPIMEAQNKIPISCWLHLKSTLNQKETFFNHGLPWDPSIVELLKLNLSFITN